MRPLADRILDNGGAWVSEHPVGVRATPASLVLRNRIQVGLTCASIVVEGSEKSATTSHVLDCARSHQLMFAVLPQTGFNISTSSELPKALVAQHGATAIFSRADYPAMLEAVANRAVELRADG